LAFESVVDVSWPVEYAYVVASVDGVYDVMDVRSLAPL
jgi:hypothetical protein